MNCFVFFGEVSKRLWCFLCSVAGAVLHTHDFSMASVRWVVQNITYMPHCYMCIDSSGALLLHFFDKPPDGKFQFDKTNYKCKGRTIPPLCQASRTRIDCLPVSTPPPWTISLGGEGGGSKRWWQGRRHVHDIMRLFRLLNLPRPKKDADMCFKYQSMCANHCWFHSLVPEKFSHKHATDTFSCPFVMLAFGCFIYTTLVFRLSVAASEHCEKIVWRSWEIWPNVSCNVKHKFVWQSLISSLDLVWWHYFHLPDCTRTWAWSFLIQVSTNPKMSSGKSFIQSSRHWKAYWHMLKLSGVTTCELYKNSTKTMSTMLKSERCYLK